MDGFRQTETFKTLLTANSQKGKSKMKPISSATTTLLGAHVSRIGTPAGEHGLVTPDDSQVAAWLAKQTPLDMDKAAVSRALSRGVHLNVRYEGRYPTGPNGEHLTSYTVAVGCDIHGKPEAVEDALADLRNFMMPAPMRAIEAWLAELSVIVAKRADDAFSEELRVAAYASRLGRYPADVVRTVLLSQTYKFWPAWEELEKRCESLTSPRRNMIAALERGPAPAQIERRHATPEERARVQAIVDEMFPAVSTEWRARAVDDALAGKCMGDAA